jgi:hypothetical protein
MNKVSTQVIKILVMAADVAVQMLTAKAIAQECNSLWI